MNIGLIIKRKFNECKLLLNLKRWTREKIKMCKINEERKENGLKNNGQEKLKRFTKFEAFEESTS